MTTYKKPTAKLPRSWDFSNDLPAGETIATHDVIIYDSAKTNVSATMLESKSVSGNIVNAIIKAGTDLADYTIKFIAVTQNYRFEENLTLKVREGF